MYLRKWLFMLFVSMATLLAATEPTLHMSTISHKDGLSNSAVISIYQDSIGLMWFGTYDGLNCYDGNRIETFKTDFSADATLDNNIVADIHYAGNNHIWVCSYGGASRFHLSKRTVSDTYTFEKEFKLISNTAGNTWAYDSDNIYYFNGRHRKFIRICQNPGFEVSETAAHVHNDGELTLISQGHSNAWSCSVSSFTADSLKTQFTQSEQTFHKLPITFADSHSELCCFTDTRNDLYLYDIPRKNKIYITNVGALIERYGSISHISPLYGDILVSFRSHGLLRLKMSARYAGEELTRNLRAFCMYVDSHQGILWVGTDGQGVIKINQQKHWANNILLNNLSINLNGQVRGIMTDPYGSLWIGTKGDGLLNIPDYRNGIQSHKARIYSPEGSKSLQEYERGNKFYPVFSLQQSRHADGFWVGMKDTALYFYSQVDKTLHPVYHALGSKPTEIHALYEEGDSVLWICTVGTGFHKARIKHENGQIRVLRHRQLHFFSKQHELLEFSSICPQGDSILWLGSRSRGLVRYNIARNEYQVFSLSSLLKRSVDDVLCMRAYKDSTLYIGTTTGLVSLNWLDKKLEPSYTGREDGLFNDMIHGIVCTQDGMLWLGTNKGLIKFNPENKESYTYYYSRGVEIGEFSDDSYYECPYSGNLFLGGVNGLLYFNREASDQSDYFPNIILRSISFGRERHYWEDLYDPKNERIEIPDNRNDFSIEFVAPDYSVNDIEYSYQLVGHEDSWSVFSKRNEAFYSHLPVGRYLFKIRYKKDVLDSGYKEFTVPLVVVAPWYRSELAWLFYTVAGILLLVFCLRMYRVFLLKHFLQSQQEKNTSTDKVPSSPNDNTHPEPEETSVIKSSRDLLIGKLGERVTPQLIFQTEEQAQFLLDVISFIEEHLEMEDLSIAYLAEHWNVSVRQFYRIFKSAIDMSPLDLVKELRMVKAEYLLKNTEMSIQEIIDLIGISSRSHFYKEFSQHFGTTPGNMREENTSKPDKPSK